MTTHADYVMAMLGDGSLKLSPGDVSSESEILQRLSQHGYRPGGPLVLYARINGRLQELDDAMPTRAIAEALGLLTGQSETVTNVDCFDSAAVSNLPKAVCRCGLRLGHAYDAFCTLGLGGRQ